MKKFNDNRNVIGKLVKEYREKEIIQKFGLSHKLELLGVELDRFDIYKIENCKMIVKDFELIALSIVLDIPFDEIKKLIDYE